MLPVVGLFGFTTALGIVMMVHGVAADGDEGPVSGAPPVQKLGEEKLLADEGVGEEEESAQNSNIGSAGPVG